MKFQTIMYAGESFDEKFGWDFGKTILFKSKEYTDISEAMKEFNSVTLPGSAWFATMRCIENSEIVSEELFDSFLPNEY